MKKTLITFVLMINLSMFANTITWSSAQLYGVLNSYILNTRIKNSADVGIDLDVYDFIAPGFGTFGIVDGTISYEQKYYLVNQGNLIDGTLVNTGTPVYDNANPSVYEMPIVPNQVFMFGYWIDYSFTGNSGSGATIDDYYGWAELQWTGSELVLLNSAGVSGAGGIYAGTWDVIPEPATVVLFLLGGFCIFIKRKLTKQ